MQAREKVSDVRNRRRCVAPVSKSLWHQIRGITLKHDLMQGKRCQYLAQGNVAGTSSKASHADKVTPFPRQSSYTLAGVKAVKKDRMLMRKFLQYGNEVVFRGSLMNDDAHSQLQAEIQLLSEDSTLRGLVLHTTIVVQPNLTDGDGPRREQACAELDLGLCRPLADVLWMHP